MRNSGAIDSTFFGFRRGVKLRRMLADTRKVLYIYIYIYIDKYEPEANYLQTFRG